MTTSATLVTVSGWPVEDQLDLIFKLWDQIIDAGWQPKPSPQLLGELERRYAAHAADPTKALTWEQVVAYLRRER